jgi:2-keto-3-deoxy-L-rhamnonate aldolase RhmA
MDLQTTLRAGVSTGTFIKTAHPQVVEVLGGTGLAFGVVDAEHAPFDRNMLDLLMLAGRAANLPLLVRIPDKAGPTILQVLDLGAAGLVVPHVNNAEEARSVVARARYRGGERGFSGSPRFAGYGAMGMKSALDAGDRTVIMCQIESADGLANARAIAEVPGVDALFIGRADLALALGHEDIRVDAVTRATHAIIDAAKAAGKIAAMFVPNIAEREQFSAAGATCFVVGSDQSMMRQGAMALAAKKPA